MIELVFVACLSASPMTCERQALQFIDITEMSCTLEAPPTLAQWIGQHPGWRITRWMCRPMGLGRDA